MNLQKHFTDVRDFRVKGRCLHELSDILIIVLLGKLADCSDFSEIEDYAKDKESFLREELGLILLLGIPSEDTLSCVVRFLKPTELEKNLRSACKEILQIMEHKHIRIDGKEMRGTIAFGEKHPSVTSVKCLYNFKNWELYAYFAFMKSPKINLSDLQPELLEKISKQKTSSSRDKERAS